MKKAYVYQIVDEERHRNGHYVWTIRSEPKNGRVSERKVGGHVLKHMYAEKKIAGHLSEMARIAVGLEKRKPRATKEEMAKRKENQPIFNLPDVWEP